MTTLGKYQLHEQLGKGGFGTVFRATDTSLGREVALKILHPQLMVDDTFVQRFIKEARTLASLEHPNIVPVHDLGESDGRLFIAMRYLPGGNLQDIIRKSGHLDYAHAIKIMSQICDGLQTAHERELVHRDIKPANILFDTRSNTLISDFGLARAVQVSGSSMSSASVGAGTPAYRAPELWRGKPPATPATDVYSLACMLVEMLTGKTLFDGSTPDEILTQHLIDGPTLPEQFPADCPTGLREIVLRGLNKDPSARQKDANGFFDELMTVREKPVTVEKIEVLDEASQPLLVENSKPEPINFCEMSLDLGDGVTMEFVHVPAGEFLMGSDPDVDKMASKSELPQHKVYLDDYWIGKFPVTTKQFHQFGKDQRADNLRKLQSFQISEKPITTSTWSEASEFCNWLSEKAARLISLPSEAQWEKAARGIDGRIYPWGKDDPDCEKSKYLGCKGEIDPVGVHPSGASPYGVQDMAGNIWHWVYDWYQEDYYSSQSNWINPMGPIGNEYKVLRGGSWKSNQFDLRCANRFRCFQYSRYSIVGFRCVILPGSSNK